MPLKEGEIVRVDYTAMSDSGQVFNTTIEKKAVEEGIFDERHSYKPVIAVVGEQNFFEKIDEAIKQSGEGQKISIELEPGDAFGERKPELIKMISLRDFKARKLTPFPGMPVEINNMQGRVQTVSGGRVRVDFNHPLAGKKVKYEIQIKGIVKGKENRINALLEKYFPLIEEKELKHECRKNALEVMIPEKFSSGIAPFKKGFAEAALKYIEGIQKVRFVEEYSKKEKKESEKKQKEEKKPEQKKKEEKPHS